MNNDFMKDEELKEALKRERNNIVIPDSTPSWLKVQVRLQKRKRRREWMRRLKLRAAIIMGSFIVSFLANMTTPTAYSQVASLFKKIKGEVVEFFYEKPSHDPSKAKTAPPDDTMTEKESHSSQMWEVTLEEAIHKSSFPLLVPAALPEGFHLNAVRSFGSPDEQFHNIQQEYMNAAGEIIHIIQRIVEGKATGMKIEMDLTAGEYKELMVNGNAAVLLIPRDGNTNLEWLTNERILVHISGRLTETEIIELAKTLK
ncbi:DUF4367 domain-containing protein [Paenibacillus sp. GCM10027626]|uniref:DUF4367 domain-containing protein n=1 Tax=Paenibacillus sp. GCM10027626 TaxID=3273411 RepID=UPI003643D285